MVVGSGWKKGLISAAVLSLFAAAALGTASCEEQEGAVSANVVPVQIAGKTFHLEVAADSPTQQKGLGGRTSIAEDGGMIFVFTPSQTTVQNFVMRDCPIDIDIMYLDGAGRVLTTYTMKAEAPRAKDGTEGKEGEFTNQRYEERLKRYSSRFPSPFVIELRAGTIDHLGVKEGDQVVFDTAGLKRRAR